MRPRRAAHLLCPIALTAAWALLLATPAAAHDNGLYASLKLGTTDVEASFGDVFEQAVDGDDDSRTVEIGYRWSRFWAIQAGYHDFGEIPGFGAPCTDETPVCTPVVVPIEAETKAYSLAIVPQLPLGKRLSIFVKVGVIALDSEVRDTGDIGDFLEDFSDEDVLWGAGLRLGLFGPIQIFYEYEGVGEEFETQAFGATWQF